MSLTRSRPVPMNSASAGTAHPIDSQLAPTSSGSFSALATSFPGSSSPALPSSLSNSRPRRPSATATRTSSRRISSSSSSATPTAATGAQLGQKVQTRARSSSRSSAVSKTGRTSGSNGFHNGGGKSYEKESKFDRLFGTSSGGNGQATMMARGRSGNGNNTSKEEDFSLAIDQDLEDRDQEQDEDDATYSTSFGKRRVSNGSTGTARRESSVPASGGSKGKKEILRCERCHKVYHHPQSLIKHRWQHTDQWNSASSYGLSKHQTVQALEAAVILSHPDTLSLLPEDRSHWPAAVSPATSGLLGSERLNIEVLRTGNNGSAGYSQSVPTSLYRNGHNGGGNRFGTSLGSMLEEEQEEQEATAAAALAKDNADQDDSTDSEDDFGIYATGGRRDKAEPEARQTREDTEMAQMDEEMFSLDLASQNGGGTPAGHHAQLPTVVSSATQQQPPSAGLLAYTRNQHNSNYPSPTHNAYSSQSALRASSHSRKQHRGEREQSTASGSTDLSTNSTNSETTHSNETGETGLSNPAASGDQQQRSSRYPEHQQALLSPALASPHHSHLNIHNHPNGLPNLSISAPVLGFFTEQNPPQATVVSPHLGPTMMTSPLLRPTIGGAHPHLVPVPMRQQAKETSSVSSSSYTAEETAVAEVLASSPGDARLSTSFTRSSFQHPSVQASPRHTGIPLIPQHGRTLSNGRITTSTISSSPYARSPYISNSIALPSTSNGAGAGTGFSTSFGQAPLGSSFRSASAAYSTPSPLVRPVDHEENERMEDDDEIMDMDL